MRECSKCGRVHHRGKQYSYCHACAAASVRASYARKTPEQRKQANRRPSQQVRNRNLKKYGIDHELFEFVLAEQGGCCRVCKNASPKPNNGRSFVVDHSHATGGFRGIICQACNSMLGYSFDKPSNLIAGSLYLATS